MTAAQGHRRRQSFAKRRHEQTEIVRRREMADAVDPAEARVRLTGCAAGAAPLDVKRLAEAILASVSYEPSASRFVLYEDDGPEVLAERIAAEYARLSEGTDR